jgi:hypothetical protein
LLALNDKTLRHYNSSHVIFILFLIGKSGRIGALPRR